MTKDELWQQTYNARQQIWETNFGPFPELVQKLMNLFVVWPGGCLVQQEAKKFRGLWITSSFGLTNSDMPTGIASTGGQVSKGSPGPQFSGRLQAREPRKTSAEWAGYGYELALLTRRKDSWPLMVLNWAVQMEVLNDIELRERVEEVGAVTIEGINIGEGGDSDFLISLAPKPLPSQFELPNGKAVLLVAVSIHPRETKYALAEGQVALLERLMAAGIGPISSLDRKAVV